MSVNPETNIDLMKVILVAGTANLKGLPPCKVKKAVKRYDALKPPLPNSADTYPNGVNEGTTKIYHLATTGSFELAVNDVVTIQRVAFHAMKTVLKGESKGPFLCLEIAKTGGGVGYVWAVYNGTEYLEFDVGAGIQVGPSQPDTFTLTKNSAGGYDISVAASPGLFTADYDQPGKVSKSGMTLHTMSSSPPAVGTAPSLVGEAGLSLVASSWDTGPSQGLIGGTFRVYTSATNDPDSAFVALAIDDAQDAIFSGDLQIVGNLVGQTNAQVQGILQVLSDAQVQGVAQIWGNAQIQGDIQLGSAGAPQSKTINWPGNDGTTGGTASIPSLGGAGADFFVFEQVTQTLTNKTLNAPTINGFNNAQHTHLNAANGGRIPHGNLDNLTLDGHPQYAMPSDLSIVRNTFQGTLGLGPAATAAFTFGTLLLPQRFGLPAVMLPGQIVQETLAGRLWIGAVNPPAGTPGIVAVGTPIAIIDGVSQQTLNNKTLTTPIIASNNGFVNANHAHQGPNTGGQVEHASLVSERWVNSRHDNSGPGWACFDDDGDPDVAARLTDTPSGTIWGIAAEPFTTGTQSFQPSASIPPAVMPSVKAIHIRFGVSVGVANPAVGLELTWAGNTVLAWGGPTPPGVYVGQATLAFVAGQMGGGGTITDGPTTAVGVMVAGPMLPGPAIVRFQAAFNGPATLLWFTVDIG